MSLKSYYSDIKYHMTIITIFSVACTFNSMLVNGCDVNMVDHPSNCNICNPWGRLFLSFITP